MNRNLTRLARGLVLAGALFAVACGSDGGITSGGGGGGPTSGDFNKDPADFARAYYFTFFRVFTGDTKTEDLLKLFDEGCRSKFAPADIAKGLDENRDELPKLKGAKIEDLDFQGNVKVEKTNTGATVTIPPASKSRVKVDGKWLNAFDYFKSVGVVEEGDKDDTSEEDFILSNGRYYLECDELEDIAAAGKRANATPTPARSTATPQRATTPSATSANRTPTPSGTSTNRTPAVTGTPPRTSTPDTIGR